MKKLFAFIIMAGLALAMQAQDITNKLATNGNFYIKDNTNAELFKVDHSGHAFLGGTILYPSHELNITEHDGNAGLSLNSFKGDHINVTRSKILFYSNSGSLNTPVVAADKDPIGWLEYHGYDGSLWKIGAKIQVNIDGTITTDHIPMSIDFITDNGSDPAESRMIIKADGTVGIGTDTPAALLDVNGSFALPYKLVGVNYTVTDADYTIVTAFPITITLPDPSTCSGRVYVIKEGGAGVTVTVISAGSATIDGAENQTLNTSWQSMMVQSTGSMWITLSK